MATASYHNYINSIRGTSGVFWLASSLIFGILFYIAIRRLQKLSPQEEDASKRSSDHPEAMTLEEAYRIKTRIAERDFPLVFSTATNSVFFKAEGIPSVAKLVARAAQRSSSSSSSRKKGPSVAPLDLLTRPGAAARQAAIDRVNYIHSFYRPSGKMSDDDLLYVLSLFALEPSRWIARFEWRQLTARERAALATLWRALGEELRIPFTRLPSSCNRAQKQEQGQGQGQEEEGFRDALHWLSELEDWACEYERTHREKTPESVFLGQKQLDGWMEGIQPGFARRWARGWVAVLIEPGLRRVMGIENPSAIDVALMESVIYVRKLIRRCLYASWH
ncbi:hypothetical protein F5Y08DRAFT_81365 [Xylaria arbuscula]|nr:hypothetical protein F5Y08DRAFT_81365 [Xylaria arbuscula]